MRLICFGDSWTAGHGIEEDESYVKDGNPPQFIERLRLLNAWPRWLANKLDIGFVNFGRCGISNEMILEELQKIIDGNFIKEEDLVIVMFSHPHRFRTPETSPLKTLNKLEDLLKGHKRFYFNSFYPTFIDEDIEIKDISNFFINPSECVSDVLKKYEQDNNISVWEYQSRSQNCPAGEVFHPNMLGYKIIAEYIYQQLQNRIHDKNV